MVAALSFVSNAPSHKIYALCVYQALIVGSLGVHWLARRRRLQAKFLDYRALSEALRVAIFWKIARVDKSVSEIYPICQSPELSWIKSALLSLECFDVEKPTAARTRRCALSSLPRPLGRRATSLFQTLR